MDSNGRVVKEPGSPQNLVMQITGPDEMGFECPLNLPAGVHWVRVGFRILCSRWAEILLRRTGRKGRAAKSQGLTPKLGLPESRSAS